MKRFGWVAQIKPDQYPERFPTWCKIGGILAVVKVGVAVALGSLMSISMMLSGVVGGVADIVLFIVVTDHWRFFFHAA